MMVTITCAGESIVALGDVLQKYSAENRITVDPSAPLVYAKFKQNPRPSKLRSLVGMTLSSIQK